MSGAGRPLTWCLALTVALAACGKKGPPLPPVRVLPATPGALTARQLGDDILIAASLRPVRTDGSPLPAGTEVRVLRMPASSSLKPGLVSERYLMEQFLRDAGIVAVLDPRTPEGNAPGRIVFRDRGIVPEGEAASTAAPSGFLYGLRVVEPGGKSSAMRPPVLIEPARPPASPGALIGEVAEGEVRLKWEAAPGGSAYNVYRRDSSDSTDPETPLNPTPLTTLDYVDKTFHYDTEYQYFVRTSLSGRATPCESPGGPIFTVRPHDRFAPGAPTGIAVAVEGDQIRVYWFPNAETDLAGYRIYRRAEGEKEATKVADAGPTESAWADTGVVPGVRYYYAVSAIDGATPVNEGPRSEERSERLTPVDKPADAPAPGAGKA